MTTLDRARDTATPPDELDRLAASADDGVRHAVASNPSTGRATLAALARNFPGAVARNPSCPADFSDEETFARVLAHPACPQHVVAAALADLQVDYVYALSGNPALTGAQIRALLDAFGEATDGMGLMESDVGTELLEALAIHPNLPEDIAREWAEAHPVLQHLAANPMLPRDLLESLAEDSDAFVRSQAERSLARHGVPYPVPEYPEHLPD